MPFIYATNEISFKETYKYLGPKQLSAVENVKITINWLANIRNKESKGSSLWVNIVYILTWNNIFHFCLLYMRTVQSNFRNVIVPWCDCELWCRSFFYTTNKISFKETWSSSSWHQRFERTLVRLRTLVSPKNHDTVGVGRPETGHHTVMFRCSLPSTVLPPTNTWVWVYKVYW